MPYFRFVSETFFGEKTWWVYLHGALRELILKEIDVKRNSGDQKNDVKRNSDDVKRNSGNHVRQR